MNTPAVKISEMVQKKSGITRLTLSDFRNYAGLRLEVGLQPIVITGENGSGKTNILEAVSFLTPGRGLRRARLADVKRRTLALVTADYAHSEAAGWAVSAIAVKNDEEFSVGTATQKTTRENEDDTQIFERRLVQIDGQKISSQAELGKYLSAIWITPQMDRLFLGGAQPRRSFLDRMVYAFDMEHAKRTAGFEHLYKQWYQLLRNGQYDTHWLSSLEEEMAGLGVAIAAARRELIARLNHFIRQEPDDVFPDIELELDGLIEKKLDYLAAVDVEDEYRGLLCRQRRNIGLNDYPDGVQRTDFKVYYKKKHMPAELCSTGEQKSLLISILLAQTKCQILDRGFSPILLLDEVATHLDDSKRDALWQKIKELKLQAWMTSTESQIFDTLKSDAQFLEIKNNGVVYG